MEGKRRGSFTIVELLVVLAILATLMAIALPSLARSRAKARFVRWEAYNASLNNDEDVVINYNFQNMTYRTTVERVSYAALRNGAAACDLGQYAASDYDGILRYLTGFEWRQGRYAEKRALQFDGRTAYVEVLGYPGIDFDPIGESFTIMAWVYIDRTSLSGTLFSKGTIGETQYDLRRLGDTLEADVGESGARAVFDRPALAAGGWYHVALRSNRGAFEIFVNGRLQPGQPLGEAGSGVSDFNLVLGTSPLVTTTGGGKPPKPPGKPFAADNSNRPDGPPGKPDEPPGNAYGRNRPKKSKGATVVSATSFFQGRMDEFLVFKEALSDQAIKDHYRMGAP